ncbi:cadherin-like domain-containing protein, partial [Facilibium subflavum]|uniref:cadherin-like domain-containing protein n=1 Tax=Facilibium subflavum TaxID=2219058 RepID=UPI0013C36B21
DVTAVNDAPVLTAGGTLNYVENAAASVIDSTITLSDIDDTNIESATVTISGNFASGEDVLGFSDTVNITGSYNASTGVLTLTGSDTLAAYQSALRSVTYENTSENPDTNARTISWVVNDGDDNATAVTSTVNVTAVNDAPTAANNTVTTSEGTAYTFSANDFNFADVDGDSLASVEITTLEGAGSLQLNASDVTLNQVISKADIDAGLLVFTPAADANGTAYDSFGFSVNDGTVDSA